MEQHSSESEAYSFVSSDLIREWRLRKTLASVSRLAFVLLLSPLEPRRGYWSPQRQASRDHGQSGHREQLHEEKHRSPDPTNPEKVQQCRECPGEGNPGKPFPMAHTERPLHLLREEPSLAPQMPSLFSITVTSTAVWAASGNSLGLDTFISSIVSLYDAANSNNKDGMALGDRECLKQCHGQKTRPRSYFQRC